MTVVSPFACEDLAELLTAHGPGTTGHAAAHGPAAGPARDGRLAWVRRDYLTGDLDGAWLVHTATGDARVDAEVAADAEADRVFCVTAGDAERATAWVPAVARTLVPGAPGTAEAEVTVAVNAGRDPGAPYACATPSRRSSRRASSRCDRCVRPLPTPARRLPPRRRGPGPRPSRGAVTAPLVRPVGSVALVGGGPGDAGLISVRGRRVLAEADVVVVDRLAPRALLAELGDDVVVVDVGKTSGNHPVPQDEINRILVHHALVGRRVVRLKGGDPYVFGRGGEELDACRAHGIPVEVVPGVTSAVSVPAAAGIPVTHRGLSRGFTVLTGHEDVGKVPAASDHTVVLLMGVSRLGRPPRRSSRRDGRPRRRSPSSRTATARASGPRSGRSRPSPSGPARPTSAPAVTVVGDVVTLSAAWPPRTPPAPR